MAPTDSTVLILGETGTGKELIARQFTDDRSARAGIHPSQLCGHPSFADCFRAVWPRERRLHRGDSAPAGTFRVGRRWNDFLDEVGELPLETQVALLRVLQEREFSASGQPTVSVDVRVIAATNRDLKCGRCRYVPSRPVLSLNVVPIRLPSLRERLAIFLIGRILDRRYAKKVGKRIRAIDEQNARNCSKHTVGRATSASCRM